MQLLERNFPNGFRIRSATNSDTSKIVEIVCDVLKEYGLVPNLEGVDQDLLHVEEVYEKGVFGILERNGKMVGTFGLLPLNGESIELRKMYFIKDVRGFGMGKIIVNELLEISRNGGFKKVVLETASPLIEAIGLYKKIGFLEVEKENHTLRCDKNFEFSL